MLAINIQLSEIYNKFDDVTSVSVSEIKAVE